MKIRTKLTERITSPMGSLNPKYALKLMGKHYAKKAAKGAAIAGAAYGAYKGAKALSKKSGKPASGGGGDRSAAAKKGWETRKKGGGGGSSSFQSTKRPKPSGFGGPKRDTTPRGFNPKR